MENSELLDKAAQCDNIAEQIALVTTFVLSSYASSSYRVLKPFNPLLGETYEWDRTSDMGWRLISEQVSHHPPVSSLYVESKHGWKLSEVMQMSSKFRGKHIAVIPKNFSRVEFPHQGRSYRFTRPTTYVHNIIIGKLYTEHSGETLYTGEGKAAGWTCSLTFQSSSLFSRTVQKKIHGEITDPNGKVVAKMTGAWDEKVEVSLNESKPKVIWRHRQPADDSHLYYNFTIFASQLNEEEDNIAPTDSRLRPDQRLMENGNWDEANDEKVRLEEKQRERRKNHQDVEPIWFSQKKDSLTGEVYYAYTGNYWECKEERNWEKCADIF